MAEKSTSLQALGEQEAAFQSAGLAHAVNSWSIQRAGPLGRTPLGRTFGAPVAMSGGPQEGFLGQPEAARSPRACPGYGQPFDDLPCSADPQCSSQSDWRTFLPSAATLKYPLLRKLQTRRAEETCPLQQVSVRREFGAERQ